MYRLTTKFLPRLGSKSHNTPSKKNLVTSVPSRDQVKTQVSPPDARNALRNLCSNPEAQKNGIHGYKIVKMAEVPELAMTGVVLQHEVTGAQHCHFARDDPNNMFSVMFRTTPTDSTGVAHILEHTTLCGSNKYPVRDPFFKMLNRSLATFMNALTGRDYTMYPFTTQNKKDYFNLMSVYLDAVFNPQLRELDFRQEGWRLEHAVTSDPSTPITFKGVVYNEMKGVYSDSQSMYFQEAQSALLPENTYGCSYGGDPKYITDLSWQQLRDFHGDHYHPSNSKFLTYGNLPLDEVLQETDSYLVKFERNDNIDTKVTNQPRWTEPRSHHVSCAPDPMAPDPNKQTTISISYLLNDITDLEEEFTLGVICHLLVSGESAPFYQALLGANIGADYSPITGYDCYMKEGSFSVGLRGISEGDIDKVKAIIKDTIDDVIKNGFDQKNVDAYLHKLEIGQKEQTTNFGVMIAMGLSSYYNHDADPLECVQINKAVQRFRNKMADNPEYLQEKVKQYFKDNQHHLVVVMTPRESYEQERDAEEESRLEDMIQTLSEKDRTSILDTGIKLQELQTGNEDLSCLPTLRIEDIDKKIKPEFADSMFLEGVPVQICEQPTNGLTYVRMVTSMSKVPPELAYLVPLFCNVITRMDAGDMNYQQLSQKIDLYTGGLDAGVHVTSHPMDTHMVEQSVVFSSKCLDRNVDKMLDIWKAIFNGYNLKNRDRLLTLINMTAAEMSSSVVSSGHSFAMSYAKSSLQPADAASEGFSGMTQLKTMKVIAEGDNVSHEKIREHLEEIAMYVLNKENMRVSINATRNHLNDTISKMSEVVGDIHGRTEDPHFLFTNPSFHPHANYTQFEMPFSVNFMSNAIQTVPISHKDYPVLKVLSKLLWSKYLHKEIREKGGAYGSGAVCGHGTFTFFSYRDPNSTKTLDTFADSIKWVLTGDFSDTDVEEAKLSVFQEVDKPVKPGDAGMKLFLSHLDDILRQEIRDGYFRVDKASIIRAAEQYLLPGKGTNAMSFLGPANETIQQDSKWNVIRT